jgi:hypothetical protein
MKFGVIVCPKCKSAKGVLLLHKTTRCNRCGKTLTINKLRILHKTNSESELRHSIGLINAEIEGKSISFEK